MEAILLLLVNFIKNGVALIKNDQEEGDQGRPIVIEPSILSGDRRIYELK